MKDGPGGSGWLKMFVTHPDSPKAEVIAMGYWRSSSEPDLPDPRDFVDAGWDPRMRKLATLYLDSARPLFHWCGYSYCRLCEDRHMGSRCLSDGAYVWPEGLSHYVRKHGLRLPDEFMGHIKVRMKAGRFDIARAKAKLDDERSMERALRGRR